MNNVRVEGLEGVLENLRELEGKEAEKLVRHSLREGAKTLRNEMKRRAKLFDRPETPNPIWKAIKTRSLPKREVKKRGGDYGVMTGLPEVKKKRKDNASNRRAGRAGKSYYVLHPLYYAKFLEYGTSSMKAQPFIRISADTQRYDIFRAIADDLNDGIQRKAKGG